MLLKPGLERELIIRKFKRKGLELIVRTLMFRKVIAECKKQKTCTYCGAKNPIVKKMPGQAAKIIMVAPKPTKDEEIEVPIELLKTFETNPVISIYELQY